jgi:hypothetical protein
LPVRHAGIVHGHFRLVAATRIARPTPEQRRVAITLADQVGAALATDSPASDRSARAARGT